MTVLERFVDGRRGAFLIIAGLTFLPVSISWLIPNYPGRMAALSWLPNDLNIALFGLLFSAASITGLSVGLLSRRVTARVMAAGFTAVMIPPTVAAGLFLVSALLGASPTAWTSASLYACFSAMIYIVAGWPNPTRQDNPPTGPIGGSG